MDNKAEVEQLREQEDLKAAMQQTTGLVSLGVLSLILGFALQTPIRRSSVMRCLPKRQAGSRPSGPGARVVPKSNLR